MGTNTDWGTFVGPNEKEVNNLSRESAITFMKDQNLRMPYGGEFAHPRDIEYIKANGSPIFTDGFVKELYDTHLSYARNIGKSVKISEHLKTMVFSEQYAFEGMARCIGVLRRKPVALCDESHGLSVCRPFG